jgi:predicted O-methyltransferase YrrM
MPAGLRALPHRIWRALYNARHPGAPWLSPEAIEFLNANLSHDMRGLEWGSGRSTLWLGHRVAQLTSVEHNPEWHERVTAMLAEAAANNVELILVPIPSEQTERDAQYWENPYVAVADRFPDAGLDLVLVDGAYRQTCVAVGLAKVKPGGLLVVDNTAHLARLSDWGVPSDWPIMVQSARRFRDTTIWRRPPAAEA